MVSLPPLQQPGQHSAGASCFVPASAESYRLGFPPYGFMLPKAGLAFSQVPYKLLILFLPHVSGRHASNECSGHSVPAKTWQQGCHLVVQIMLNFGLHFT